MEKFVDGAPKKKKKIISFKVHDLKKSIALLFKKPGDKQTIDSNIIPMTIEKSQEIFGIKTMS